MLRAAGAVPVRTRGSHRIWRFPSGRVLVLKVNHSGVPPSPGIRHQVRKALAAEGATGAGQ